jgi:hypothetical protein
VIRTIPFLLLAFVTHLWAQLPQFKDVSREVGLTVPHISTPDKQYIVESMSGGVGLIDCDNDGKLDIIVANGSTIDHFRQGGDSMITLYHQDRDFKFSAMDQIAGAARYDEPMQLFRNKGDGTFDDIPSVLAGIPGASRRR